MTDQHSSSILKREIPSSGEEIPAIGIGTGGKFDLGAGESLQPVKEVLKQFVEMGGSVVDTSPMYGNAESVIGEITSDLGVSDSLFLATKVWTRGKQQGIDQMKNSMSLLRTEKIDLMQIHNLVDFDTHIETLRRWKDERLIRYIGITHYRVDAFEELERLISNHDLDFVQLNYSVLVPDAEKRLFPLCLDTETGVIVNRPFEKGGLFRKTKGENIPDWAKVFCGGWSEFGLKFILSHPAVTTAIPATGNPRHLKENMRAGTGNLPDQKMRQKMVEYCRAL